MKRLIAALSIAAIMAMSATASAQLLTGGHDETSENLPAIWMLTTPPTPTPSTIFPGPPGPHVLISEFVVTPTAGEFIEICNPTLEEVGLAFSYLSDDWYSPGGAPPVTGGYHRLPMAGYVVGTGTDFIMRFPSNASILPGERKVVALDGAGFIATYGFPADYEINGTDPGTPDMINVGGNATGSMGLTNSAEIVVLFHWDGVTDLVCDIDYVVWDDASPDPTRYVDKTGELVDGPDADAIPSPYNPDTPQIAQLPVATPAFGSSQERVECAEAQENPLQGGNGCIPGATPTSKSTWGQIKVIYR